MRGGDTVIGRWWQIRVNKGDWIRLLVMGLKDGWFTGSGYKDGRGTGFFQCSFSGSVCPVLVSFFFFNRPFGIRGSGSFGVWMLEIWDFDFDCWNLGAKNMGLRS